MSKHNSSGSESEENDGNSSPEDLETPGAGATEKMTEYEKLRLCRIRENRARFEALGLPKMASSVMGLAKKECRSREIDKGKKKMVEDEDYRPLEGEDGSSFSSEEHDDDDDDEDDDEEFVGRKPSVSRVRKKIQKKSSKPKKKVPIKKILVGSDFSNDDDALMQAIALSLQDTAEALVNNETPQSFGIRAVDGFINEGRGNAHIQEDKGRRKRKKPFSSRVQMTEDELVIHFFQFDEVGKGNIILKDLQRVAAAHDFTWTDKEMVDMIYCFDTDGDGKLSLEDFRKIVGRCNMLRGSENAVVGGSKS